MARHSEEARLQQDFAHYLDAKGLLYTASMAGGMKISRFAAVIKKRMGCKAGLPDILIFEPRGAYFGMFIELKAKGGDIDNVNQRHWQRELNLRGYLAIIMPNTMEYPQSLYWLKDIVESYLAGKEENK
jgi:hypothetical protein